MGKLEKPQTAICTWESFNRLFMASFLILAFCFTFYEDGVHSTLSVVLINLLASFRSEFIQGFLKLILRASYISGERVNMQIMWETNSSLLGNVILAEVNVGQNQKQTLTRRGRPRW